MSRDQSPDTENAKIKDPAQWVTGGEPMTGAQESYLHTLARQAGEDEAEVEELTKAEASEKIEELREKTGKPAPAAARPKSRKKAKADPK